MKLKKFIPTVLITAAVLTACAQNSGQTEFAPTEDTLYITSEGSVTSAVIEQYDNSYYTEEELKSSVEEALAAFNNGGDIAALNTCTLSGGEAKLLIDFKTTDGYLKFMEEYPDEESPIQIASIDIASVTDGLTKGYITGATFKKPGTSGKTFTADEVAKKSKFYVAAIEGPAKIQTDGAIQYVSDGVTVSGNIAQTPESGVSYIIFK